jgi:hypothetical protein
MSHEQYTKENLEIDLIFNGWVLCEPKSTEVSILRKGWWLLFLGTRETEFYFRSMKVGTVGTDRLRFEAMGWLPVELLDI